MAAKKKSATRKKVTKKVAKKRATAKKPARKKAPAKKAAPGKTASKKVSAKKKAPTKKAASKKPTTRKSATKSSGQAKAPAPKRAAKKPVSKKTPVPVKPVTKVKKMGKKDLEYFRKLLLNLRDQVVDEISFLAGNNLNREHVASSSEEGTDNFERELAMKLVGSEQDLVYEIDEALSRITNGTYGICEISGDYIERERLKVLPHARYCVQVQSEMEKGRTRYRPFGPTLSRSISD